MVPVENDERSEFLQNMAKKYIWWKTPEEAMFHSQKLLSQIMNLGEWDDVCILVRLFSEYELKKVLENAEIGQFNGRSWHFWNHRLIGHVPPMPERELIFR